LLFCSVLALSIAVRVAVCQETDFSQYLVDSFICRFCYVTAVMLAIILPVFVPQ